MRGEGGSGGGTRWTEMTGRDPSHRRKLGSDSERESKVSDIWPVVGLLALELVYGSDGLHVQISCHH